MYLDFAATTPLNQEVLEQYVQLLTQQFANADSLYSIGRDGAQLLEKSRANVAQLFNVKAENIIFTSSGSEANALAIKGYALNYKNRGKHIITTAIEHASVLQTCQQLQKHFGFEVTYLPCDKFGVVSLDDLKKNLRTDTILVSIMKVNNETGSVHDVCQFAQYVHQNSNACFHSDMVQALGKEKVLLSDIDMASFSAHKINGLKGSAILYLESSITLMPLITGGQQESGLRGGTVPWQMHTMWAKTLRIALENNMLKYETVIKRFNLLKDELVKISGIVLHLSAVQSPYILNFATPLGSEILLNAMNEQHIYLSAHSTCSSRNMKLSHVLLAQGLSENEVSRSVRVSLAFETSADDILIFVDTLKEILNEYNI